MVVHCIRLALTVHKIEGKVRSLHFHSLRIGHKATKKNGFSLEERKVSGTKTSSLGKVQTLSLRVRRTEGWVRVLTQNL